MTDSLQDAVGRLTALLQRVEGLTGHDREVDVLIWLDFTPGATRTSTTVKSEKGLWPDYLIDETRDSTRQLITVPAYTASLDAALALVEEVRPEWGWGLTTRAYDNGKWQGPDGTTPHYRADLFSPILTPAYATAFAATAPLALLAALLKSLIHAE